MSLKNIDIPGSVEVLHTGAFQECVKLANVNFKGEHLKTIGEACFNKTYLSSITLPYGLESLGYEGSGSLNPVFLGVYYVVVPSTVKTIGSLISQVGEGSADIKFLSTTPPEVAPGCSVAPRLTIYVPQESVEAYKEKFNTENVQALPAGDYEFGLNSSADYGTICVERHGDYTEGIEKLYTVGNIGENSVQLVEKTDGKLEPGVPYIFKKQEGATTVKVWYAGLGVDEPVNTGCLKSTFAANAGTVPTGAYVLQSDNMFHKVGSTPITFVAHRAYLELPKTVNASAFTLDFSGTTGILNAVGTTRPADTRLFDLFGRQTNSRKGIVIKNGKKYLFK